MCIQNAQNETGNSPETRKNFDPHPTTTAPYVDAQAQANPGAGDLAVVWGPDASRAIANRPEKGVSAAEGGSVCLQLPSSQSLTRGSQGAAPCNAQAIYPSIHPPPPPVDPLPMPRGLGPGTEPVICNGFLIHLPSSMKVL